MNDCHQRYISEIHFGDRPRIVSGDGITLIFNHSYHGDRDELWVIQYLRSKEVARHNVRHIHTIIWVT